MGLLSADQRLSGTKGQKDQPDNREQIAQLVILVALRSGERERADRFKTINSPGQQPLEEQNRLRRPGQIVWDDQVRRNRGGDVTQ